MFQLTTCDVCQRMIRKLTSGIPEMHPIAVKAHSVGIWLISISLVHLAQQVKMEVNTYFRSVKVGVIPTKNKKAVTVSNCLCKVC